MEGLITFLLFGAFFYFMMRYGCGAHMVHGGHGSHGGHGGHSESTAESNSGLASATDPVCGMTVAADAGYARMYEGREYRFCSRKCLDTFEGAPSDYVHDRGGSR